MKPEEIAVLLSDQAKHVRSEYNLSQEKMAALLGISKKTLIQVEKGRCQMSWSAVVALSALFSDSEILYSVLGDNPLQVVKAAVLSKLNVPRSKTMGGKVWWRELRQCGGFRLQQNLVSGHYRILDAYNQRWFSSVRLEDVEEHLHNLTQSVQEGEFRC